jgi:hypothetical protein
MEFRFVPMMVPLQNTRFDHGNYCFDSIHLCALTALECSRCGHTHQVHHRLGLGAVGVFSPWARSRLFSGLPSPARNHRMVCCQSQNLRSQQPGARSVFTPYLPGGRTHSREGAGLEEPSSNRELSLSASSRCTTNRKRPRHFQGIFLGHRDAPLNSLT